MRPRCPPLVPGTVNAWTILAGAALGALLVMIAESISTRGSVRLYAYGLALAALAYVAFAIGGGATAWVPTEIGGGLFYLAAAVAGLRGYPLALAVGWGAHVGWDLALHGGTETEFVPLWYVSLCVGFDLVVAGAILAKNWPPARLVGRSDQ